MLSAGHKIDRLDALLIYIEAADFMWTYSRGFQLGLYYVAQHAVEAGYRVKVDLLSMNDHVVPRLLRLIRRHSCPVLGLYVDHDNQWALGRITTALKREIPDLAIILGGPQVTGAPEQTMERIPAALCGAIGDGEETFAEFLGRISRGEKNFLSCPGLVVNTPSGPVRSQFREPILDLDRLSFPRRKELTLDRETEIPATMTTGRGCTGRCAFCYEGGQAYKTGKRLRLHSVERCLDEFDYLAKEYGGTYITIQDDTFVANPSRLRAFCREVIRRHGNQIRWFCEARVDTLSRHADLMPLMIEAGLIRLQIGGESGDQSVLNLYRKDISLDQLRRTVQLAWDNGLLSLYINFIIGGAGENKKTYLRTKEFALELIRAAPGCVETGKSYFTPYPGTPMAEHPDRFGIQIIDAESATAMGDTHVFCRTESLSRQEITALGHDFDESIRKEFVELASVLPIELASRHFEAYYRWGLSTTWFEILSENLVLYTYLSSLYGGRGRKLADIPERDQASAVPLRMVQLIASRGDKYIVRAPDNEIFELDAFGQMIMELSGGKLAFHEIEEVIRNRIPELDSDRLRSALLERYRDFDQKCFVLWRTDDLIGDDPACRPDAPKT